MRKKFKAVVATILLGAILGPMAAAASSIKTWSNGSTIQATDLNSNFNHLHNTMVGGHGARLVNADVSASAAIEHSKLATPALLPKAWAAITSACDGAAVAGTACTVAASSRVTSVTSHGTAGQYRLNLGYTPTNAVFGCVVTSHTVSVFCTCHTFATSLPNAIIQCVAHDNVATNAALTVQILDNDN